MIIEIQAKNRWHPIEFWEDEDKMYFKPGFNKIAKEALKSMNITWCGGAPPNWKRDSMHYSADKSPRNLFTLDFLRKDRPNPYLKFKEINSIPIPPRYNLQHKKELPPFHHQQMMVDHIWTHRTGICAAQMRTGKTLCMGILMERQMEEGASNFWLVGPKSALAGVQLDFQIWGIKANPTFMTYERLRKLAQDGIETPHGVYFDEASRVKNPKALRTQAAQYVADHVRSIGGIVSLWTGTPSPKAPVDWWSLTEIACPGYLAEANTYQFTERYAIQEVMENPTGGTFNKIKTWLDNPNKCALCGKHNHKDHEFVGEQVCEICNCEDHLFESHPFVPSVNEIEKLYSRLKGLTIVVLKDDVLDLPDKVFEKIILEPSANTMRMYNMINKIATSAATALTMQRELSDGFIYKNIDGNLTKCERCEGSGSVITYGPEIHLDQLQFHEKLQGKEDSYDVQVEDQREGSIEECPQCNGTGLSPSVLRTLERTDCPKEEALIKLLEEHEEVGRFVVYAGFQGSIDKVVETCLANDWSVIRVDGRGWHFFGCNYSTNSAALAAFAKMGNAPDKLVWVGHPASGGMGVSLSASPTILFYSNSFAAEDRLQALERIHDMGMNRALGAKIIDFIHLPTDQLVLDNLDRKEKLQKLTMGDIKNAGD